MVDKELAGLICGASGLVQESPQAHRNEHALEVHLPFLQYLLDNDFQFVPITVGTRRWESLEELGDALALAVDELDDSVLMISSSDMNHFESAERTEEKDHKAIEHILRLDDEGLYQTVESESISMCGCGPTVSVLRAAKKLGAEKAELIQYSHSGLINGDLSSVVGYAGLVIY
jgi:AmmeMemoRadiSam system protein B